MEQPPPYEEQYHIASDLPTLSKHLSQARSCLINDIVKSHVLPQFQTSALSGLSRTAIILLPAQPASSASSSDRKDGSPQPELLGFPSDEHVHIVRLIGEENPSGFWQQPVVVQELEKTIKSRLAATGHQIWNDACLASTRAGQSLSDSRKGSGFFKKKLDNVPPPVQPITRWNLLLETSWATNSTQSLPSGQIMVAAGHRDISTRVTTDLGLYDVKTERGVVIRIKTGS